MTYSKLKDKIKSVLSDVDWLGDTICVLCIPVVIIRHAIHIIAVLLSVLAVMLSDVVCVFTGRSFPQNVQLSYFTEEQYQEAYNDKELPAWYVRLSYGTCDDITQFHEWLMDFVSPQWKDKDGGDDGDSGGTIG